MDQSSATYVRSCDRAAVYERVEVWCVRIFLCRKPKGTSSVKKSTKRSRQNQKEDMYAIDGCGYLYSVEAIQSCRVHMRRPRFGGAPGLGLEYEVKWGRTLFTWVPEGNLPSRDRACYHSRCGHFDLKDHTGHWPIYTRVKKVTSLPSPTSGARQPREVLADQCGCGHDPAILSDFQKELQEENKTGPGLSKTQPYLGQVSLSEEVFSSKYRPEVRNLRYGGRLSLSPGWNQNSCPVDPVLVACFAVTQAWDLLLVVKAPPWYTIKRQLAFYRLQQHLRENIVNRMRAGEVTEECSERTADGEWIEDNRVHHVLALRHMLFEAGTYPENSTFVSVTDFASVDLALKRLLKFLYPCCKASFENQESCENRPQTEYVIMEYSDWANHVDGAADKLRSEDRVCCNTRAVMVTSYGDRGSAVPSLSVTLPVPVIQCHGTVCSACNICGDDCSSGCLTFSLRAVCRHLPHRKGNESQDHFDTLVRFVESGVSPVSSECIDSVLWDDRAWWRVDPYHGIYDPVLVSMGAIAMGEERLSHSERCARRKRATIVAAWYVRDDLV